MSTSCGASGIYGILLSLVTIGDVSAIYGEFTEKVNQSLEKYEDDGLDAIEDLPCVQEYRDRLVTALKGYDIVVPESAQLLYTGSEDDRPANCDTPSDQWVLGFGLFRRPSDYPLMDQTFIDNSQWHTWAWMG